MSEEMAVSDNTTVEVTNLNSEENAEAAIQAPEDAVAHQLEELLAPQIEEAPPPVADSPPPEVEPEELGEPATPLALKQELEPEELDLPPEAIKMEDMDIKTEEDEIDGCEDNKEEIEDKKCIKRRASSAFSENADEDFKGFIGLKEEIKAADYTRVLERLEAEVTAATRTYTPLKTVMATPPVPSRASKRARKDTEGSRPSSSLSTRSDGDGSTDASSTAAYSPAARGGRRATTTEITSPLLRVPLERGWKRELVYRAALDAHSRRNADIYYYTPYGKKLRSTREVNEHLAGTGLTLENFSFFKEPLGVDDPEKEIIRDAKLIRRMDSPIAATTPHTPVEGKRTPKPKAPKGASPEPVAAKETNSTVKSPPAKIKVKSVGSRLSTGAGATPKANSAKKAATPATPATPAAPATPATAATPAAPATPATPATPDNNNSSAWKKPRPAQPPPLVCRPVDVSLPPAEATKTPDTTPSRFPGTSPRRHVVPACSMTCGRGVPSLSCAACLCLYHAVCAGYTNPSQAPPNPFLCKNCRIPTSPPVEPPPLTHKSGVTAVPPIPIPIPVPIPVPVVTPVPRRVPIPVPVPVPVPAKVPREKRVLLRMKVAGGTPDGERVWAVSDQPPSQPKQAPVQAVVGPQSIQALRARGPRPSLPQSLAIINGRRFIIVPRSMVTQPHETSVTRRGRVVNGAASPPAAASTVSPRRRGRQRVDEVDHFTTFYTKAQESNECFNVVVQIFQYLGMRDLARCARVCRLWKQLAATPALWRHVRMKNSHVSSWGGLCAALRRHATKRLDLRKMLLPADDGPFWEQFAQHIGTVDTLERVEMCRCPAASVEALCGALPSLRALSALAIRDGSLDPAPLAGLPLLHELRIKSVQGLTLTRDLRPLAGLASLTHLSLTSIKELGRWLCDADVLADLPALESLELGECTFGDRFACVLARLVRLRRLRLERGTPTCLAADVLRAAAALPLLTRLELVNVDVKPGFDDALASCHNVRRLLIIPTYVSQSATTNRQVLGGVLRLRDSLTHLVWGVTIELLRVTELFIDQCEQAGEPRRRDLGECIPVLKPVPGCRPPGDELVPAVSPAASPATSPAPAPQVEILPLPTLQRLLSQQLPHTKLKLLRIPFHATWRQSLADFH